LLRTYSQSSRRPLTCSIDLTRQPGRRERIAHTGLAPEGETAWQVKLRVTPTFGIALLQGETEHPFGRSARRAGHVI